MQQMASRVWWRNDNVDYDEQ